MKAALLAEWLKLSTTKTGLGLLAAMLGLVTLAVLLHGFALDEQQLTATPNQVRVLIAGESVGVVFAALLGALSITAEFRHGTIRPTLLGTPQRSRVILAKAAVSMAGGVVLGFMAASAAVVLGLLAFSTRGIGTALTTSDLTQLIAGGAVASGLWAVIGLGLGCLLRHQVPTVIGIFIWLQIVENLLVDSLPDISRYLPGALGQALAGSQFGVMASALTAFGLLLAYTAVLVLAGTARTERSDIN